MRTLVFGLIFISCLSTSAGMAAEVPTFGFRGGYAAANVSGDVSGDNRSGAVLAFFVKTPVSKNWIFQGEFQYVKKGARNLPAGQISVEEDLYDYNEDVRWDYLQLAGTMNWRPWMHGPYLSLGAYFGYRIKEETDLSEDSEWLLDANIYERFPRQDGALLYTSDNDVGLIVGIGQRLKGGVTPAHVDVRYEYGLKDLQGAEPTVKTSTLTITFGVTLF